MPLFSHGVGLICWHNVAQELLREKSPSPVGPSEKELRCQAMEEHEAKGDAEDKPWSALKRTEYETALELADANLDKKRIQGKLKEVREQIAAEKERKRLAKQALADEAEAARKAAEARRKAKEEAARLAAMQEELARRRAAANATQDEEEEQPYEPRRRRRPPSPKPRGVYLWAYLYAEVCQKVPMPKVEAAFCQVDEQHGGTGALERQQLLQVCALLGLVHEDPAVRLIVESAPFCIRILSLWRRL